MIGIKPTVFLLTDFGIADHYVAVMKAVILQRCPEVAFVDISHEVAQQGVEQGAYLLESTWPWLPQNSVLLAVVDPGVGTGREAAVFFHEGKCVVGPNNGLLSFLPDDLEGRVLDRPEFWLDHVSATFHGRDIFAPCAGFLASGGNWKALGTKITTPVKLAERDVLQAGAPDSEASARIIHFDHFGNAITNFRWPAELNQSMHLVTVVLPDGREIRAGRTYADVAEEVAIAYPGSTGHLEIGIRNGNAKASLLLELGVVIRVLVAG